MKLIVLILILTCFALYAEERMLTNPVAPVGNDPWVIRHGDMYYYCYSGEGGVWVNAAPRIEDAVQCQGIQVWKAEPDSYCAFDVWAPELHFIQGHWYIYVAANNKARNHHRMHVLKADTDDPLKSFSMAGKIYAPSDKWAIDGTVLEHKGELYFIWSGWEGDADGRQDLYIAHMKDPLTIDSERALISKPEYEWEIKGRINEGPEILKHDGRVFIIYSASGSWTDFYCLGKLTLTGSDPLDPKSWTKSIAPVFTSTNTVFAPGHCSFTTSPDGKEDWIVYHCARRPGSGWNRTTHMKRFTWDTEGNPSFGCPLPENVPFPAPSGS